MKPTNLTRLTKRIIPAVLACCFICFPSIAGAGSGVRPDGTLAFLDSEGNIQASIVIEIARSEDERSRGLMERRVLGENEGMLFVYDRPGDRFFWMRNTYVSLDIIFVSAASRVIHIARETEPLTETRHWSRGPAQYVVEVVGGFSERHGIAPGSKITWQKK